MNTRSACSGTKERLSAVVMGGERHQVEGPGSGLPAQEVG